MPTDAEQPQQRQEHQQLKKNPAKNQRKLRKETICQVQKLLYKVGLRDGKTPTLYTSPCQIFFWKAKNGKIPEKTEKKCQN
jgi:hypothetical protein